MRSGVATLAPVCGLATLTFVSAALLSAARPARADAACSGPLSPCINDDTLWVHAGVATFVAIGSTRTIPRSQLGFGLVTSYLSRPVVLEVPSPGPPGSNQYAVNDQVNSTFLWAYGVTDRLELDLALPITLAQGGTGLAPLTGGSALKETAVRDMRFGLAYALGPHDRIDQAPDGSMAPTSSWGLAVRFETSAPTGDQDQFAGESSAVFVPSVSADYRLDDFFVGAEIGARLRPTTDLLTSRVGSELIGELGVGYDILPRKLLTATAEAWAFPILAEQGNGGHAVPAEWQVAARTALRDRDLSIQLGGGGALESDGAITTPRFRFTLGVRWAPSAPEAKQEQK